MKAKKMKEEVNTMYKYDIAISYQEDLEESASRIADYLQSEGLDVFFAPSRQREMLSEKLHQILYDVYKNQSLVKVLLVTDAYLKGEWTSLEMRMALESTEGERKRLIIVNYIGDALPNNLKVFVYLDGKKLHEDQIASCIAQRTRTLRNGVEKNMKTEKSDDSVFTLVQNNGIISGDKSNFGDIHF